MANESVGRKPDYNLAVLNKDTDSRGTVGVAWNQPDGTIRVKINACTVIDTNQSPNMVFTLFKTNATSHGGSSKKTSQVPVDDDDAPF